MSWRLGNDISKGHLISISGRYDVPVRRLTLCVLASGRTRHWMIVSYNRGYDIWWIGARWLHHDFPLPIYCPVGWKR